MGFYIYKDDQQTGPFNESEVEAKLRDGTFISEDLACREGEKQWHPLSTFFPLPSGMPHSWMGDSGNLKSEQPKTSQHAPPRFQQQQQQTNPFQPHQHFGQPMHPQPVQHIVHHHTLADESGGGLQTTAMVIGIVCASLMLIGLIPCLGWINWFVLLVGGVNKILSIIAVFTTQNQSARNKAIIGLILTIIALFIGSIRLILGSGIC